MLPSTSLTTSYLLFLTIFAAVSDGLRLPARATTNRRSDSSRGFRMKGHSTGSKTPSVAGFSSSSGSASGGASTDPTVEVENFNDFLYKVDVTIGGTEYTVQMDTGSSDLWIFSNDTLKINNRTDVVVTETYGIGQAEGPVVFANFQIGDYKVPNQAFIKATSAEGFAFFNQGAVGIMGLSFDDVNTSPINAQLKRAWGQNTTLGMNPLTNLFTQNPDAPNSFDVLLDRSSDLDDEVSGTFLISEHHEDFEHVTEQPKLFRQSLGRWSILLDNMIVNGKKSTFGNSTLPNTPKGKIAVLMDTGFTFPPLPNYVVDNIYSNIPGSKRFGDDTFPQWLVPCGASANVSFTFGGVEFPVHPLDLSIPTTDTLEINGKSQRVTYCHNTFQYGEADNTVDGVMGDSFLRNAYASFDYGLTDSTGKSAYMQMIPVTDLNEALPEFRVARAAALKSLPPTITPEQVLEAFGEDSGDTTDDESAVASGATSDSSDSSASDDSRVASLLDKYGPIVLGLLAGNLLLMVILCIIGLSVCVRGCIRGGAKSRTVGSTYTPVRFKDAEPATDRYSD